MKMNVVVNAIDRKAVATQTGRKGSLLSTARKPVVVAPTLTPLRCKNSERTKATTANEAATTKRP